MHFWSLTVQTVSLARESCYAKPLYRWFPIWSRQPNLVKKSGHMELQKM